MLRGMAGLNGFTLPDAWLAKWGAFGAWLLAHGVTFNDSNGLLRTGLVNWIIILLAVVWFAPNTQQIMARFRPALGVPAERGRQRLVAVAAVAVDGGSACHAGAHRDREPAQAVGIPLLPVLIS